MGLPQRIASNIDWLTNSIGTLFGVLLTLPWAVEILRWRAIQNRIRWFTPTAPPLLALILLWPWAQLYPVSHVFGVGDGLRAVLFEWAIPDDEDVLASPVFPWLDQALDTLDNMAPTVTPGGWLAVLQLSVSTLSLWGMGSLAMLGMRRRAPQLRLLVLGIMLTLVLKALFNARLHTHFSSHWIDWEWLEARVWLSLGLAISGWLVLRWQTASVLRWFGSFCLVLALLASLLIPADPYAIGVAALQNGRLRYLHDLLRGLAWIWPMLAVFGLLNHPIHDPKRRIPPV
jgi:hypothetical protein